MAINQKFFNDFQSKTRLEKISSTSSDDVNIVFYKKDNKASYDVLLTAGVHGDEPAGVYALQEFFEKYEFLFSHKFNFYTFPCINSYGFESDYIYNSKEENINRSFFDSSDVVEARFVMDELKAIDKKFLFAMDFHEAGHYWANQMDDWHKIPSDPFFWETQKTKKLRVGKLMNDAVKKRSFPVCDWTSVVDDDMIDGVIYYPEGAHNEIYAAGTSLDSYVNRTYSKHTFTTETPSIWQLKYRVDVQLTWLITALQNIPKV